ncbi:hypothetical protein M231_04472 [Tremella mesenterica]|uniref:Uncharacterized protein n=1 Tax=Tremella mesenterica TaxID=5217 RepID=A0A4Q1BKN1_TREME|nr:hypothetical protein M231_04472 [Tremella mesenterica]
MDPDPPTIVDTRAEGSKARKEKLALESLAPVELSESDSCQHQMSRPHNYDPRVMRDQT